MAAAHTDTRLRQRPVIEPLPDLDLLQLHARFPARYPVLLESLAGAPQLARFDVLFAFPEECLDLGADWTLRGPPATHDASFLGCLDEWWRAERGAAIAGLPFAGGWFLFLGYELAREIEPGLSLPLPAILPVARAVRVPVAIIRDRQAERAWMLAEPGRTGRLQDIRNDLHQPLPGGSAGRSPGECLGIAGSLAEDPAAAFLAAIGRAQAHIAAGNVYQANLSRRWRAQVADGVSPWMLYRQLRATNPAPFAGLALIDDTAIVCSSPERLVTARNGHVSTRPIAGTRPRRAQSRADAERRSELMASAKERAEHVMLIDLERNDLGRICEPGTVRVDEFMTVESYAHVHHIVSSVTGQLRRDASPGSVIRAVFPGGTITGCPKVRCMALIEELERRPRGAYTGAMGYLSRDGSLDLNILIRTITMNGRNVTFQAGSGIVADSDPQREVEETRAKARGMQLALEMPWTSGW
jgi:anthranilate synthase component 1